MNLIGGRNGCGVYLVYLLPLFDEFVGRVWGEYLRYFGYIYIEFAASIYPVGWKYISSSLEVYIQGAAYIHPMICM